MKAYRTADGRVLLFRPDENAVRMISGADRLSMPAPPVETFVEAVKQTVLANKRWVSNSYFCCLSRTRQGEIACLSFSAWIVSPVALQ